jgi:hypothetical protein
MEVHMRVTVLAIAAMFLLSTGLAAIADPSPATTTEFSAAKKKAKKKPAQKEEFMRAAPSR